MPHYRRHYKKCPCNTQSYFRDEACIGYFGIRVIGLFFLRDTGIFVIFYFGIWDIQEF